jgi:ABC-2 type transport system permease protein
VNKYWNETLAVAGRILTELLRRRRSLISWAIFPVLILALNGLIVAEKNNLAIGVAFENAAPATLIGAALFLAAWVAALPPLSQNESSGRSNGFFYRL